MQNMRTEALGNVPQRELELRCLHCGGESIIVATDVAANSCSISCEGCQATSTGNIRQEQIPERADAQEARGGKEGLIKPRDKIYFVSGEEENSPIKIGYTRWSVIERVRQLQTGRHDKLKILAVIDGDQSVESALHKLFSSDRLTGEWFKRTDSLTQTIGILNSRQKGRSDSPADTDT